METQWVKCTNPECGRSYTFIDFKTGVGKTPEQLEGMRKRRTICKYCNQPTLKDNWDTSKPIF